MSGQANRKKWCICQVHQPGFPDAPYYVRLPQFGPWDTEREGRQVSELLARLETQAYKLVVRECAHETQGASVPCIDSITAVDENSLPDQHDSTRKYHEESLRWQSRVQHD